MERFYGEDSDNDQEPYFEYEDDDDDDDDEDGDDDDDGEEAVAYIDQQGVIDVMHIDLAQTELNQHLLGKAIEIAQKSWFWCFKNTNAKMSEVEVIYKRLLKLTANQSEEKEE